jgi:hypothetical protein
VSPLARASAWPRGWNGPLEFLSAPIPPGPFARIDLKSAPLGQSEGVHPFWWPQRRQARGNPRSAAVRRLGHFGRGVGRRHPCRHPQSGPGHRRRVRGADPSTSLSASASFCFLVCAFSISAPSGGPGARSWFPSRRSTVVPVLLIFEIPKGIIIPIGILNKSDKNRSGRPRFTADIQKGPCPGWHAHLIARDRSAQKSNQTIEPSGRTHRGLRAMTPARSVECAFSWSRCFPTALARNEINSIWSQIHTGAYRPEPRVRLLGSPDA